MLEKKVNINRLKNKNNILIENPKTNFITYFVYILEIWSNDLFISLGHWIKNL